MKYIFLLLISLMLFSCTNIGEKYSTPDEMPPKEIIEDSGSSSIDDEDTKELIDAIEEIADEIEKQ